MRGPRARIAVHTHGTTCIYIDTHTHAQTQTHPLTYNRCVNVCAHTCNHMWCITKGINLSTFCASLSSVPLPSSPLITAPASSSGQLPNPFFLKEVYFTDPAAERMGRSRSRSRSRERRRDEDRKRSRPSDDFASARDFDRQDSRRVFTSLSLSVAAQNRASTQCLGESVERLRVRVFNTRPCLWLRAGTFQASALGRLDASGWCLCRTSS